MFLGEGKLIHTLLCHNSDVTSVSWCPVPYNVFQLNKMPKEGKSDVLHFEKNDKTFLLASCCSDLTIYISRAGTDNHCETLIKLPPKPVINITRYENYMKNIFYIFICNLFKIPVYNLC